MIMCENLIILTGGYILMYIIKVKNHDIHLSWEMETLVVVYNTEHCTVFKMNEANRASVNICLGGKPVVNAGRA